MLKGADVIFFLLPNYLKIGPFCVSAQQSACCLLITTAYTVGAGVAARKHWTTVVHVSELKI